MARDRRVMVRFDERMHDRLQAEAEEKSMPVSILVRLAVWKWLAEEDAQRAAS